jgi:hypothetical protein
MKFAAALVCALLLATLAQAQVAISGRPQTPEEARQENAQRLRYMQEVLVESVRKMRAMRWREERQDESRAWGRK